MSDNIPDYIKEAASKWALKNADETMATNSALNRGFIAGAMSPEAARHHLSPVWMKCKERLPEKKGEYFIKMVHRNSLPEDGIEKSTTWFIPKSGWQEMEGGWTVLEWLDEHPSSLTGGKK